MGSRFIPAVYNLITATIWQTYELCAMDVNHALGRNKTARNASDAGFVAYINCSSTYEAPTSVN